MLLALATLSAAAKGKAQITFDTTAHDFGTIKENGGKVSASTLSPIPATSR